MRIKAITLLTESQFLTNFYESLARSYLPITYLIIMSKIIEIEDALNRINGDNFQELCNHFLFYKLNPNSIDPIGSVIGKEKSRKGIPDCYFTTKEGELVFAEYTTKEKLEKNKSFLEKLKEDITNCFDQSKTSLKPEEISKVILCFTSILEQKERKELRSFCDRYNERCILELIGIRDLSFAVLDFPLLGDYLGIRVSTGQIQNPSDFIADYEKSKLSTPLSNTFHGRQEEIKNGLIKLTEYNILLIYGAPGTGKSKYAIELIKEYSLANKNVSFLCIGNKGLPIWEDLKTFIRKDKKYILLVDDANRLAKNYQWILSLLNEYPNGNIKIVVTVRDYALSQVKEISRDFYFSSIEITEFSKDDIRAIIASKDFNIHEPAVVERILDISKGNARLAIMSAKIVLDSKNILLLNDASQIYDTYFNPIFKEIKILNEPNTLISLVLLSFFGKIDKENRVFCERTFVALGFDENKFWEICYALNECELVDLFEYQIVKISDQVFSTYIFYKVVIDLKIIKFNFFLDNFLDYENRITDTIIPVLNTFNYKKIEKYLYPLVLSKWQEINSLNDYETSLKYLDLFWFYLHSQVLVFFKRHADKQDELKEKKYRYTYDQNEFSYGLSKDIELLSRFKYLGDERFKDALELLFYIVFKFPTKLPALIYTIKENFCFTRLGYRYGDYIPHTILNFLIDKAENSSDKEVFENILLEIIPDFLRIEYHEHSGDGHTITIYTFHLWLSDSVKSFRKKCFEYLDRKAASNKSILLQSIYKLPVFDYKVSKKIYNYDKALLFSLIDKYFNPNEFEDCFIFQKLIENLTILKLDYPKNLKNKFSNKLFQLTEILKSDKTRKRSLSWEEEEKLHEKELINYCKEFYFLDYLELFDNVNIILRKIHKSNLEWQYCRSLEIIIGDIARKDCNLFLQVLTETLRKFVFQVNYLYIFNVYFKYNSKLYYALFSTVKNSGIDVKLCYHRALITEYVSSKHLQVIYKDLHEVIQSIKTRYFFWDLTFINKYSEKTDESIIFISVLDRIINKIKKENVEISVGRQFIEKCLSLPDFPVDKIIDVYLYSNKFEEHFDYKKSLLRQLFEKDNTVIFKFLKFNFPDKLSYHDLEHEGLTFIWEFDNYSQIVTSLIDYFLQNSTCLFGERSINAIFPKCEQKYGDRPIVFLEKMIIDHFDNEKYMKVVFNIICYSFPNVREEFLKKFLAYNSNFALFENLELVKKGGVYNGSIIPYIDSDKNSWQKIMSVIDKMPNRLDFIQHKEYVTSQMEYCALKIKREMKREFLDDFR